MDGTTKKLPTKHICAGLLAHVDAGKTTLSESMLYISGSIRKPGRVDHGDAFLDTFEIERERGITVFSKQAVFSLDGMKVTLMDTPGHVDFSAEMERTLQILDYAVLVVNGADGIKGHTQTLWRLLDRYRIPVFLFVNKMDQEGTDRQKLLANLKERLSDECVDFDPGQDTSVFHEQLAMCDESLLEQYLEDGCVREDTVTRMIAARKIFPCYFGSALRMSGVGEFLHGLAKYIRVPEYPAEFGAKVYKIARDDQGNRLTYMKITGGSLKVKDMIGEKADQIRIYSGAKYEMVQEAEAGDVCAVTGLTDTFPGQGIGIEASSCMPVLEAVLTYRVQPDPDTDIHTALKSFKQLEEEEPQLHVVWNEDLQELHVHLMGEVQTEILKRLVKERFGIVTEFVEGNIVYKETILAPVAGMGHFEPLRHYAEVHLLLEPGEKGSGLKVAADCSEDMLDRNWQRLVMSHLEERSHAGVLTGSVVTDMKITLIAGQAHQKHTQSGDFRQAAFRALRQGLKKAACVLLEPFYEFCLEVPAECVGRAMMDIQVQGGTFGTPVAQGEYAVLSGTSPVAAMRGYQSQVTAYTKGQGRLTCLLKGYEPCHNAEEVIENIGYDSERDLQNPADSVFCSHGAGIVVKWDKAEAQMHVDSGYKERVEARRDSQATEKEPVRTKAREYGQDDKELEAIFERTYGPIKRKRVPESSRVVSGASETTAACKSQKKSGKDSAREYLLVDGYNIIYAWDDLKELAGVNLMSARDRLMDILSNYQGYRNMTLILVFDAYKVEGNPGSVLTYHNIHVVYTKEAETADQYIEKTVHRIGRQHHVTVATSDAMEQVIILGQGGHRMSAKGLRQEILQAEQEVRSEHLYKGASGKSFMSERLTKELVDQIKDHR